jgi:tryptophanyl-tRNA synthetase
MDKTIVLSGIRATGKMHLGNYLGAIRNFANLSQDHSRINYYFIANLHTLTTRNNPVEMQRDILNIVVDFISCGIDPANSVIFAQSSVPETCELNWLLACLATVPELERMPHFKEKKQKKEEGGEAANVGLLTYPVLMAADILGPKANLVPVGEDQHPHVEFARELARRFNNLFGPTFPVPDLLAQEAVRVPGLDGGGKMGKSDGNTIDLADTPEIVKKKLAAAVTDPARIRRNDPGDPSKCNIYTLHTLMSSGEEIGEVCAGCKSAGIGCVDCKRMLGKNINSLLAPIQSKKQEVLSLGPDYPRQLISEGGKKARVVIAATVNEAKEKMGVPSY